MFDPYLFGEGVERRFGRMSFYLAGAARDLIPPAVHARTRERLLTRVSRRADFSELLERVGYYNKLSEFSTPGDAIRIDATQRRPSYYYYDFKRIAGYFPGALCSNYFFADLRVSLDQPTLAKSRPIRGDNANNVLLKLNRRRHFVWSEDRRRFRDKINRAVWRGIPNNDRRIDLMTRYGNSTFHDIGYASNIPRDYPTKRFLSRHEQLGYRYPLSVEGNDVATNLKWILSSNSLCMMPRPTMETWFMEGTLKPNVHYVELRDDFADLDDKIAHFDRHPDDAEDIIAAAHRFVAPFRDAERELLIGLLVLQKYFECSGQIPPRFFA